MTSQPGPGTEPPAHDPESAGPSEPREPPADGSAAAAPPRGRISRLVRNKGFVKLVGAVAVVALLYYAFFVVLPQEIDWDTVWAAISDLTASQLAALGASALVVMVCLGWAARASLPGLRLYQGFESSATSQMTAFVVPPPGDYVIRFAMYRTYGFTDEQSGISVIIALVLRYVITFLMPIIGLAAVLLAGQGTADTRWWFVGYTTAFLAVVLVLRRIVRSDGTAHAVGRWVNSLVTWTMDLFHRSPSKDIEAIVVEFGRRTRGTAESNRWSLLASNLAWGLSNVLVLGMALRFSGLGTTSLSAAEVLLMTGIVMVVNVLPVPGINALIVPDLSAALGLTSETEQSQLTAALALFRVCTWVLPMIIGVLMFFVWRYRVRRDTVTTVNTDREDDGGWDSVTPGAEPTDR
jgi:uncharacterized membrane protein YbhN (UPF0104 family)